MLAQATVHTLHQQQDLACLKLHMGFPLLSPLQPSWWCLSGLRIKEKLQLTSQMRSKIKPSRYSHSSVIGLTECLAPVRWLDLPWHPIGHWMLKFVEIMACNALYFFKLWTGWTMQLNLQPWFSLVRLRTWVKGGGKKISEANLWTKFFSWQPGLLTSLLHSPLN